MLPRGIVLDYHHASEPRSGVSHEHIVQGLFEVGVDGAALVGGFSPTSGRHHFPLADTCPYSGATDVERRRLSRRGRVWAATTVRVAPPGYVGDAPYGLGVVELPEGLRVIARLEGAPRVGDHVVCVPEVVATPDGPRLTWAFAPAVDA
jgi:uncharacterized OB-fold protein